MTSLHTLKLLATESNWRLSMVRKADAAFLKFQDKVFQRDEHTCQFCGFSSHKHMEAINLDGDFHNNKLSNMVTACPFCSQCYFMEAVGKREFGGGALVYFPEMTQGELNAFCHVLFSSIVGGFASAAQAKNIFRGLKLRSQLIEKQLGEGMSNPSTYGRLLIDVPIKDREKLQSELAPVMRLLPDLNRFMFPVKEWLEDGLQALNFDKGK